MPKSTEEWLNILKNAPDLNTYLFEERDSVATISLADYLNDLCAQKNISPAQCIKKTNLARTYAYQIFSGQKHPDRDKVLALCFGFSLSLDETQTLLKTTGYPILYAKTKRDSVIIFGLQRNCSLINVNELLFEMDMELI